MPNNLCLFCKVVAREVDTIEKRSATATVTVNIEDMNDNEPEFISPKLTLDVLENTAIGTSVEVYQVSLLENTKN